jgi:hypothetical protein
MRYSQSAPAVDRPAFQAHANNAKKKKSLCSVTRVLVLLIPYLVRWLIFHFLLRRTTLNTTPHRLSVTALAR